MRCGNLIDHGYCLTTTKVVTSQTLRIIFVIYNVYLACTEVTFSVELLTKAAIFITTRSVSSEVCAFKKLSFVSSAGTPC
jgi:hypothetical protein